MENFETIVRFTSFLGAFALFGMLELFCPDRKLQLTRLDRWTGSLGLLIISGVFAKLALPAGLAAIAVWAAENQFGLFNSVLGLPFLVQLFLSVILLDLAIWAQHVASHNIPFLWKLHRVHHSDPEVDVTTAFRFHPLEIILSLGWKVVIVCMLGAPVLAVFWFQVLLNAGAQFNHANIKLPKWLDSIVRIFVVTPAMHRVHHSVRKEECNSNYGFFLSMWDRMFNTYKRDFIDPASVHIGYTRFGEVNNQRLDKLLLQPLKR